MYLSSLLLMVDQDRRRCYYLFEGTGGPIASNSGTCFNFACISIFHWRRIVKTNYIIKSRCLEALLF